MDAVIYARISSDQEGRGLGVERQIQDCTAKAQALGWNVAQTYVDNDVSASKNVPRPRYQDLIDDITDSSVKALVVYDLDRLTRQPRELEDFIDLAESTGVALANVSGDVDLTTANGKMIARIKGSVARQEADRIKERVTRQKKQYAESGKRLGGRYRSFGYDREWNVIEEEAELVREIFNRLLKGESQHSITRDFQARGITTTAGKRWAPLVTSRMSRNAMYAGINVYKGEVLGATAFDPIIDRASFDAVNQPRATSPTATARNTRKYLMSGFLVCYTCKTKMYGFKVADDRHRYRCDASQGGCGAVSIKASWVDEIIEAWMSQVSVHDSWKEEELPQVDDTEAQKKALDERIAALQASDIDLEDLIPMIKKARAERKILEQVQAQAKELDAFRAVGEYQDLDLSQKRGRIAMKIKYITVRPGRRSVKFEPRRLALHMHGDERILPIEAIMAADWRDPEVLEQERALYNELRG